MRHAATRFDHLIGAALAAAYVAVLLYTAPALGLSRDEGIYVWAAESYGHWFEQLSADPGAALSQASIDRYWQVNREHPALPKTLFAWSHLLDARFHLFSHESLGFRFPGMLCAGLLLWLLHVFGTRLYGRAAGLFAAAAYALLPRPFYHAHLDAFDVPITLAVTAVSYAYLRSLQDRRWAWLTGLCFGAALATKHNSWFLPGIFALHFACVWLVQRLRGERVTSRVPYWLFAMLLLGPPLFVGSWPWLWHDTLPRIERYAAFHLHHEYYNIAYFGVNYFWPPFPISYPWVMTLYTVPLATLACAALGLWVAGRAVLARLRGSDAQHVVAHETLPEILALGCLLAPLIVIALPSTPIFGGTKHWFTAYPFMALFAARGFTFALERARALLPAAALLPAGARRALLPASFALVLAPALLETAHAHPFALSHYGMAAGFVAGAAEKGMNRQFWGFTTGSLVSFLNDALPNGGRVYPCDTLDASFRMLSRDGLLLAGIVPTPHLADADFALVHHEHHFAEVDHQIWTTWASTRPVHVLTYDGVPIISVYENPRHAARRAR